MGKVPDSPGKRLAVARAAEKDRARAEKHRGKATDPNAPIEWRTEGPGFSKDSKRERMIVQHDDGTVEEQWLVCAPEEARCQAKIRNGPYAGNRCRKPRLLGAKVCSAHGGNLPNIKKAAQMRILAAADLAVAGLVEIAVSRTRGTEDSDRIRATLALLDRAGIDGKQTVTIEVKPWQEALQALVTKDSKKSKSKGSGKKSKRRTVRDGQLSSGDGD